MVKTKARLDADARFEASRVRVLVRFTEEEAAAIDKARGAISRPQWVKAKALAPVKEKRKRT